MDIPTVRRFRKRRRRKRRNRRRLRRRMLTILTISRFLPPSSLLTCSMVRASLSPCIRGWMFSRSNPARRREICPSMISQCGSLSKYNRSRYRHPSALNLLSQRHSRSRHRRQAALGLLSRRHSRSSQDLRDRKMILKLT